MKSRVSIVTRELLALPEGAVGLGPDWVNICWMNFLSLAFRKKGCFNSSAAVGLRTHRVNVSQRRAYSITHNSISENKPNLLNFQIHVPEATMPHDISPIPLHFWLPLLFHVYSTFSETDRSCGYRLAGSFWRQSLTSLRIVLP